MPPPLLFFFALTKAYRFPVPLAGTDGLPMRIFTRSCLSLGRAFSVSVRLFCTEMLAHMFTFSLGSMTSLYAPLFLFVHKIRMFIKTNRLPITLYLVDAFHFAASATAAGGVSLQGMPFTFLFLTIHALHSDISFSVGLCNPTVRSTDVQSSKLALEILYVIFTSVPDSLPSYSPSSGKWLTGFYKASRGLGDCARHLVPYMDIL